MPPINLYTNSAINAAKASAATRQTSNSEQESAALPSGNLTPSITTSHAAPYSAARPGAAAAMPAPTGAAQRYAPPTAQPTPTTTFDAVPSAPQPGAFPVPVNPLTGPRSNIPPPPKVGEKFIQPPRAETVPTPQQHYPSQMYMPPPTTSYGAQPPTSSTITTTTPSVPYPVPVQTAGPPGYRQNPYASDLNPDQRRAQDAGPLDSDIGGYNDNDSANGATSLAEDAASVWNTVSLWASKAGEKISEAESEVWKRVNK